MPSAYQRLLMDVAGPIGFITGAAFWVLVIGLTLGIHRRIRNRRNGRDPQEGRGKTWLLAAIVGVVVHTLTLVIWF